MAKKSKTPAPLEISGSDKEVVRVTFRLHGPELIQVREVREMLSLNSELDAARYLMQRGLEALAATLASRRFSEKMATEVSPEKVIAHLVEKFGFSPEEAKKQG